MENKNMFLPARNARPHGFTVIELLVMIIIIGILAAIAMPHLIGAQDKVHETSLKANLRLVQIAVESYATDNGGSYPRAIDTSFKSYFQDGSADGKTVGSPPINPFTNKGEWPVSGNISNVQQARSNPPCQKMGFPGQIQYSPIASNDDPENISSYAIIGINKDGKALADSHNPNATLVLSNQ